MEILTEHFNWNDHADHWSGMTIAAEARLSQGERDQIKVSIGKRGLDEFGTDASIKMVDGSAQEEEGKNC